MFLEPARAVCFFHKLQAASRRRSGKKRRQEMNKKVRDARAKKSTRVKAETVERSSGNVFADLGFHDADDRLWKAQLATAYSRFSIA